MKEMNVSYKGKKAEALRRMKKLGIFSGTVKEFRNEGILSRSEQPVGAYYWVEGKDLEKVKAFEEKYNALVYSVIRSYTYFGTMDAYLYVSDNPEEWATETEYLEDGEIFAWVENQDEPTCSEFGYIGFKMGLAGGLLRTA